jgi:hypothetical protein
MPEASAKTTAVSASTLKFFSGGGDELIDIARFPHCSRVFFGIIERRHKTIQTGISMPETASELEGRGAL